MILPWHSGWTHLDRSWTGSDRLWLGSQILLFHLPIMTAKQGGPPFASFTRWLILTLILWANSPDSGLSPDGKSQWCDLYILWVLPKWWISFWVLEPKRWIWLCKSARSEIVVLGPLSSSLMWPDKFITLEQECRLNINKALWPWTLNLKTPLSLH